MIGFLAQRLILPPPPPPLQYQVPRQRVVTEKHRQ